MRITIILLLAVVAALAAARAEPPAAETDVLGSLRREHPRLLLNRSHLVELKKQAEQDAVLRKAVAGILAQADKARTEAVAVGLDVEGLKRRVYLLGFACLWTGDATYAGRVEAHLLAVCALKDWEPEMSFLRTAETAHIVGLGYDWTYDALSAEARATIRAALVEKGLRPYLAAFAADQWWTRTAFNWNQVCNGGEMVGALAIADEEPELVRQVLACARKSLPRALKTYDADGLWPEGLDYWQYATDYTVLALASLETALGGDLGLDEAQAYPGLARAADAVIWGAGPFGQYVNFADTLENKKRWALPYLFWLGRRYVSVEANEAEYQAMQQWPTVLDIVWYPGPPQARPGAPRPLDKLFRGSVELATFRSAWADPNALFASLKAGFNEVNHGHLDLGVFEIDALGVRWARDLGKDNYGLPGYFSDRQAGGKAWDVYRLRSASHSVPLIDGKDQPLAARAKMIWPALEPGKTEARAAGETPCAVVDFSSAYPAAKTARRGLALVGGRRAVLVQDEFDLEAPHELTWAMTTDAVVALDGKRAQLTLKGKKLTAEILSPAGALFSVESAGQKPPDNPNRGVQRLLIRLPAAQGSVRIAVFLCPAWPDGADTPRPEVKPLNDWR